MIKGQSIIKESKYITASEFAGHLGVHYTTVGRWCRRGLIEGAKEVFFPFYHWQIPRQAIKNGRPRRKNAATNPTR